VTANNGTAQALGELAVTPRPLSDYRNMFLIDDAELVAGPILDCPAGASPLGAQVRALGGTVVSVDPAYSASREDLVVRARADLDRISEWARANPAQVNWSYIGSLTTAFQHWKTAIDAFEADYHPDGERYVAASLPELPFPDDHFDLTLSSHLLFVYPDFFDFDTHVRWLLELNRVTRGEVRVYPLVDSAARPYPQLADVRAVLAEHGVRTSLHRAACAFNVGGDELLVCRSTPPASRP
jgi:hypothetical protein